MTYEEIVEIVTESFGGDDGKEIHDFSDAEYYIFVENEGYVPLNFKTVLQDIEINIYFDMMEKAKENFEKDKKSEQWQKTYAKDLYEEKYEKMTFDEYFDEFYKEKLLDKIDEYFSKVIDKDSYVEIMIEYVKENDDWKDKFVKFLEKLS